MKACFCLGLTLAIIVRCSSQPENKRREAESDVTETSSATKPPKTNENVFEKMSIEEAREFMLKRVATIQDEKKKKEGEERILNMSDKEIEKWRSDMMKIRESVNVRPPTEKTKDQNAKRKQHKGEL